MNILNPHGHVKETIDSITDKILVKKESETLTDAQQLLADPSFGIGAHISIWYKGVFGTTMKSGFVYNINTQCIGLSRNDLNKPSNLKKLIPAKDITGYIIHRRSQDPYHIGMVVSQKNIKTPIFRSMKCIGEEYIAGITPDCIYLSCHTPRVDSPKRTHLGEKRYTREKFKEMYEV